MAFTATQIKSFGLGDDKGDIPLPVHLPRSSKFLLNRELSLIEFFRHVLDEGFDKSNPLLERLKFLSIFSSNLDEFFMVRVSGLKEELEHNVCVSPDGLTPSEQLTEIRASVLELMAEQMRCMREEILPELSAAGIVIAPYNSLTDTEQQVLSDYFKTKIYPILTPQAVDPTHPFPYISGSSLNLGLLIQPKVKNHRVLRALRKTGDTLLVRIKIPQFAPRLVPVEKNSTKFILIEELIAANIKLLIPDAKPESCHTFRITRDADIELREEEAEDLLQMMEQNLRQRRFGDAVRLEVSDAMPIEMVKYLTESLELTNQDVYLIDGAINIADFMALYKLNRPDLKDKPLQVTFPPALKSEESIFDIIKKGDVFLHHPYMPYSIVTDFIRDATEDPDVLAIKMCLYRTGADSPIPPLLIEASERGKQVTVLIELKARFDEENNINWARRLERAGVHVVYGLLGLKTHCKTTLIVRREGEELRRYVHLATGNYNPETSAVYTDLGLLTSNEEIGGDATELFNFLTSYSGHNDYKKLLVAPINLRDQIIKLIRRETENSKKGLPTRIIAKMNRLADVEIIRSLYEASQAGVQIDLIVRGICMLRPGIAGLSENINVTSIVGRFLEHSRVYYFANGGEEDEVYIGSADFMPRNLDRRVEVLTPVLDSNLKRYLKDEFLSAYLKDNVKARRLLSDGSYERVSSKTNSDKFNSQLSFQNNSNVIKFETQGGL